MLLAPDGVIVLWDVLMHDSFIQPRKQWNIKLNS